MWCRDFPLHGGVARGGCAVMSPWLCHGFVWSPARWDVSGSERTWAGAGTALGQAARARRGTASCVWEPLLGSPRVPRKAGRVTEGCVSMAERPALLPELLQPEQELLAQHREHPVRIPALPNPVQEPDARRRQERV